MKTYSVLIADDSMFARKMVRAALENSEFSIIGEAVNGKDAIEKTRELSPGIVLLDVIMPELEGKDALPGILSASGNSTKVVMLSSIGTEETVTDCISLGASSFIQKPFDKEKLVEQLRQIVQK